MANTVFVSDESGLNVEAVLQKIVEQVPPPLDNSKSLFVVLSLIPSLILPGKHLHISVLSMGKSRRG